MFKFTRNRKDYQPEPSKKKPKKKKGPIRRAISFFKWGFLTALVLVAAGVWYYNHLNQQVEEKFSKSLRWNLPSKVYSDSEYLYPGIDIEKREIKEKLNRLGYRDMGTGITGPGEYTFAPDYLDVYLHDFQYPMEDFKGFSIRVTLTKNIITKISRLDTKEEVPIARLEPELIASVFDKEMEDRTLVKLADVPQHLLEAIILLEDERFFHHHGVDPLGILRAAFKNLINLKIVEGGSTLTQQLVKNYFLTSQRSYWRKFREAVIAIALEKSHSKKEILEAYVNEIYFGQRGTSSVSGVGEAAKLYFGKNIDQLTLGECALLAGMVKSPSDYSPFNSKEAARNRRNFVLSKLREEGLITNEEYNVARVEPIITPERPTRVNNAPYFVDFVKKQLQELYPETVLQSEGLKIFTTLDMTDQLIAERMVQSGVIKLEERFKDLLPSDHQGQLQAALISIQPQTGYIRALVGGRDFNTSQFNRITQAMRQPGSVFKPFVYLTAFDPKRVKRPLNPASYIDDVSFMVQAGGKDWSPSNYDKIEHGRVSLREALQKSYNIATARLGMEVGLENVIKTARDAGISSELSAVPSISLGSFEVSPLEIASAFTIFANNGIRTEPISIINVTTKENEVVEKKTIEMHRSFDAGPVYITNEVLKGVLDTGTAASVRSMGFQGIAAGKTGTTSNYKDAWFIGYTPDFLTLVWVGYDDNAVTKMSGARAALPIWADYMKKVANNNTEDFPSTPGIILVKIDPLSGKLATDACPGGVFEPFIEGTEPEEACPGRAHKEIKEKKPPRKKTSARSH